MSKLANLTHSNILKLIEIYPELANATNNEMTTTYWIAIDNISDIRAVPYATPAEYISRAFRELKADGRIVCNEEVAKEKLKLEREFRKQYKRERMGQLQ